MKTTILLLLFATALMGQPNYTSGANIKGGHILIDVDNAYVNCIFENVKIFLQQKQNFDTTATFYSCLFRNCELDFGKLNDLIKQSRFSNWFDSTKAIFIFERNKYVIKNITD